MWCVVVQTNSESLVDVSDRVATNEEHLVEHDGRLDKLDDKLVRGLTHSLCAKRVRRATRCR